MIDILPWHQKPLRELLARRTTFPHALLIYGQRGIGKHEFARALAHSLLCEAPQETIACGVCPACHWLGFGNHPDFRELQPESEQDDELVADADAAGSSDESEPKKKSKDIRIEQIRAVADFMTLSTHRAGFRVLLIHPAESMNAAAANALLKTLEEPPPATAILLVSDQIARLPATIRSRCQRVRVVAPAKAEALAWLASRGVAHGDIALAMAGGAPLDAIENASAEFQATRDAFIKVLVSPDLDYVSAAAALEKTDLPMLLTWLQTWVLDLVLARVAGEARFFADHKSALQRIALRAELPKLFRLDSELRQARRSVSHPLNPRLLREQLLISYQLATKPTA